MIFSTQSGGLVSARRFGLGAAVLALFLGLAPAIAQSPSSSAPTLTGPEAAAGGGDAQAPATPPASAAATPNWAGMVMVGFTQQTWQTNQRSITGTGDVTGSKFLGGVLRIEAVALRASVHIAGLPQDLVVADNEAFQGIYSRKLTGIWIAADLVAFHHNGEVGLHSRFDEMAGAGIDFKNKQLELEIIPALGVAHTDLQGLALDSGSTADAGLYELLAVKLSPTWTFTHWLFIQRDFSLGNNTSVFAYAGLTGMITKHLGFGPNYTYNYQDLVQPGTVKDLGTLSIAAQYRF